MLKKYLCITNCIAISGFSFIMALFLSASAVFASYEVEISGKDAYDFLNNATGEISLSDTGEIAAAKKGDNRTGENEIAFKSSEVSLSYSVQLKKLLEGGIESREIVIKEKLLKKKLEEEEKEEYEDESDTAEAAVAGTSAEIALKKGKSGTLENELEKVNTKEIMLKQGKPLFILHCDVCHPGGDRSYMSDIIKGDQFFRVYDKDDKIKKVIRNGYRSEKADMPSFNASKLSDFDVDSIILYLKTLK